MSTSDDTSVTRQSRSNPFEYEAANNLSVEMVLNYYIEDFNYSRFIESRRNVFLRGERGAGKTMTLRYHTLAVQLEKARRSEAGPSFEFVGVLIPCKNTLSARNEYQLLDPRKGSMLSEHLLTLQIVFEIAATLAVVSDIMTGADEPALRKELEYVLGVSLLEDVPFFPALEQYVQRELRRTQQQSNSSESDGFYADAVTFSSFALPIFALLRRVPMLRNSHLLLMMDDAHDLNEYQIRTLNSWISYRDHTLFSFKISTAKVGSPSLLTSSGGTILEGHDFVSVDMEQPFQYAGSDFAQLASAIINRRLERLGINATAEDFFPEHPDFVADLERAKLIARQKAEEKFGRKATKKQIADYVYKYARPEYFRNRPSRANRPPYAGFSTLVYLSTGVIRNLLEPCYWMYDSALSVAHTKKSQTPVTKISPDIQSAIIHDRSDKLWERLKAGLERTIEGCSPQTAKHVYNLLDQLAELFRHRLMSHRSEPAAISFSISQRSPDSDQKLTPILEVAQKAQLLYVRTGPAKERGRRETYYVPNRMLWPSRGLDPHGQHARVSIRADELLAAAEGTPINEEEIKEEDSLQPDLFNG